VRVYTRWKLHRDLSYRNEMAEDGMHWRTWLGHVRFYKICSFNHFANRVARDWAAFIGGLWITYQLFYSLLAIFE
jgi:hypothetical protein